MKTICARVSLCSCLMAAAGLSLMSAGVRAEDLDQAMVRALETSNLLKAQNAQSDALRARHRAAVGGYLPEVMFDYAAGQGRLKQDNSDWMKGGMDTAALSLSQPIVDVAALQGMGAAKSRVKSGGENVKARTQQVLMSATEAYAEVAEAQDVVALYAGDVERLGKHVVAEEERFGAGVNTKTDIMQAKGRLAEAKGKWHRAKGRLATAEATYARVTGAAPVGEIDLPAFPRDIPTNLEEALARAHEKNPDLLAAKMDAKAAKGDVSFRRAERLPTVNLLANASKVHGIEDASGVEETQEQSVMLNLRVPLFMRGREYANTSEAKAYNRKAMFEETAVQENVTEQVTAVWARLKEGEAALEALTQNVNATQASLEGLQAEFASGSRTGLDVLDARRDVLAARLDLLAQRKDMLLDAYRLLALVDGLRVEAGEGL